MSKTTRMMVVGDAKNEYVLEVYKNNYSYTDKPQYSVVNGAWNFYFEGGIMTFPKSDWRYGKSQSAKLYEGVNHYGHYNENIHRFIEEVLRCENETN